nr:DUF192 domain-containing protein [Lysobacter sp. CAU 1642]
MPVLSALLLACASSPPTAEARLSTTVVEVGGHPVNAEVADDNHERMRGLMFRKTLGRDEGMVFVFESAYPQAFWMKNTLIPLDILYFDAAGRLVSIQRDVPPCRTNFCESYPSEGPARYVLELNAGRARELGIGSDALLCERAPKLTPLPACAP